MANALNAGIAGLSSFQSMLEVTGNNLANQNTVGYKGQRTRFADLVYQTLRAASGSTTAGVVGGTNPAQVGSGVNVAAIDVDFAQGRLESTGNQLQMALEGTGFFVVNDGTRSLFTRAGGFDVDVNKNLVDPATGFKVQRFGTVGEGGGTNPVFQTAGSTEISIPFGTGIPGAATQNVTLQGNLSANATGPLQDTLTSSSPYTTPPGATPATAATLLNALNQNTVDYAGADSITISGTDVNGATIPPTTFAVGPATTLGALAAAISAAYPLATASIVGGNLVLQADATGPGQLRLTLADTAGNTGATTFAGMPKTVIGKNGDTVSSAITVFDVQGTAHNLSLVFTKQGTNTWDLAASIPAADGTMTDGSVTGITFNDNGALAGAGGIGVGDADITFQITGLAAPQTVNFSFGTVGGFTGLTGFGGNSSAAASTQDGFAAGFLANVNVDSDGVINGIFSNGKIFALAQMAVATFTNIRGLDRLGNNYFGVTGQSGNAQIGSGGTGGRGLIRSGSLEQSNVDVAAELTRLIIAQRGFQINARAITVGNQILDEVANIIR